jgi:hypothetical protein
MRQLSATLSAAQKEASTSPYVKLEARNKVAGVFRLDWARLYTGSEDDYHHALAMPADGSLVRARITLPSDSRKLYRQRITSPGPGSDFSTWTYTGQYDCVVVAAAAQGTEVSIFWINASREIRRIRSTDSGATWGSPELIDYSPSNAIRGLAAAYKANGDLAIFFADASTLYVKKRLGGSWQSSASWDKTTGDLSGVGAVYDSDWDLLVTGKDTAGDFKVWSLAYGDGGQVPAGTWSPLKELASAPSGGDFEYGSPFLDKPDVFRCFYIEKFSGSQSYDRPFWSHSVLGAAHSDGLWREPVPFNLSSQYGLAMAHDGSYCWLTNAHGVWRAGLAEQTLDLSVDVISLRQETEAGRGSLTAELRNDEGQYASPGQGALAVLDRGCQLELGLGYATPLGNEVSTRPAFWLGAWDHVSQPGQASLVLRAFDGWHLLGGWRARHLFRWNKDSDEMSVKELLEFVVGRVGLKLVVKSQSSVLTGFYPDFTIHPGARGDDVIRRLLSFVPDVIFVEGTTAYVVNPQSSDSSAYSYGQGHAILQGLYGTGAWPLNRVRVEGYDPAADEPIIVERFSWDEIERLHDLLGMVEDRNLDTVARAQERGDAHLREAEMASLQGRLRVPVNCGQQLYDVIDVTDSRAGLSSARRRVMALALVYDTRRGAYQQTLSLGAL